MCNRTSCIFFGGFIYFLTTQAIYYHDIEVPLTWVQISNNVVKNDEFDFIEIVSQISGDVGWWALSTGPGKPSYIGTSFQEDVNYGIGGDLIQSQLAQLNDPILYTYYNATIAIINYTVYFERITVPHIIYEGTYPVIKILWASSTAGFAFESLNCPTIAEYTNSSGTYYETL